MLHSVFRVMLMERALVTLTPYESRRLIGRAVANMEEVRKAYREGIIVIATSISTAYVAEELLGISMEKEKFTYGVVSKGRLCVTPKNNRPRPIVIKRGKILKNIGYEILEEFGPDDVFIKGANALDPFGNVGVLAASPLGGTIGNALRYLIPRGSHIIVPIGLEKMIPISVYEAAKHTGINYYRYSTGMYSALFPIPRAKPITEIEAYRILFNVNAIPIASGGVSGSEGSITLVLEGSEENVRRAFEYTLSIKGEASIPPYTEECESCSWPCGLRSEG